MWRWECVRLCARSYCHLHVTLHTQGIIQPMNLMFLFSNISIILEDEVFLPSAEERDEYVLNDVGKIWKGTYLQPKVIVWAYGQVLLCHTTPIPMSIQGPVAPKFTSCTVQLWILLPYMCYVSCCFSSTIHNCTVIVDCNVIVNLGATGPRVYIKWMPSITPITHEQP